MLTGVARQTLRRVVGVIRDRAALGDAQPGNVELEMFGDLRIHAAWPVGAARSGGEARDECR